MWFTLVMCTFPLGKYVCYQSTYDELVQPATALLKYCIKNLQVVSPVYLKI